MSCLRTGNCLMLWPPKMNGMKASRMLGLRVFSMVIGMALAVFVGRAEEQSPASAPQDKLLSIPVLSAKLTNDTLALSWPASATNWMLSTQAVGARGWSLVTATQYSTNATDVYMTTSLPVKTTFYRLVKVPASFRNRNFQPAQALALPTLPKPKPGARPPKPPATPPPQSSQPQ